MFEHIHRDLKSFIRVKLTRTVKPRYISTIHLQDSLLYCENEQRAPRGIYTSSAEN